MKNFAIGFFEHRKIFFGISITLMVIGLIFNFAFGTQLDINFKGGAFIKYSYSGEIDPAKVEDAVESAAHRDVSLSLIHI